MSRYQEAMEQLTIKQYLKQYNVSQTVLAKELKISDAMVSRLIRNKTTITKDMQKRLINYFESKNIQIVFTDAQLNKSKLEEKYENLEKAYSILQTKCLELIEENQILKESMKNIISIGKNLENLPKKDKIKIRKNNFQ